ncbi:MAG TPA: aminoglycoside 6-adenylyltransferase [Roseiflexaceae bacterium]|nr:aminoglycoside 6-adenylyltransferase [Roseiflexaceae bacterium]
MDLSEANRRRQDFLERFAAACRHDERIVAALMGGSNVKSSPDAFSDVDLTLITQPESLAGMRATIGDFLGNLGELVFLEHFDREYLLFVFYADGVEGEVWLAGADDLHHIRCGPFQALVDKAGILAGAVFAGEEPGYDEQVEILRRQITWFWHEMSHCLTALGRGQLWWAYSQLEELRRHLVNLMRLRHDFSASADGFEKVEKALPAGELARLQATVCPLERAAMLDAVDQAFVLYRELAGELGPRYGIAYPAALEQVLLERRRQLPA